jgi:hypothetical protein
MELKDNIKNTLIKLLPSLELCNEKFLHNKVQDGKVGMFKGNYDLCRVIPKGKKCILWLKLHNNSPTAYLYELHSKTKKILDVKLYNMYFSKYLTNELGSIFYGTFMNKSETINNNLFVLEDILYFKGMNTQKIEWKNKIIYYNELYNIYLKNKNTISKKNLKYSENLKCIMPYTTKTLNINKLEELNSLYQIYSIQYLKYNNCYVELYNNINVENKAVLLVKPLLQNDIYECYTYENENENEYIGVSLIPDYKTSVMMNKYYRNIKENINLDYLEESDSEEEFENINIDKYVDLNKEYKFECIYNYKFKKWIPIKIQCDDIKLTNIYKIKSIQQNKPQRTMNNRQNKQRTNNRQNKQRTNNRQNKQRTNNRQKY